MTGDNAHNVDQASGAALYIACLAGELARLAKSHDLEALAHTLRMAQLEADRVAKHAADPGQPRGLD